MLKHPTGKDFPATGSLFCLESIRVRAILTWFHSDSPGGICALSKPTTMETLQLNELIRVEAMELQKVQAMMPLIADADLKQELSGCVQTAQTHLKALVEFTKKNQVTD